MIPFIEQLVRKRAGFACEYCRMPERFDELPFEIDHIIARQHHGETTSNNLALTCFACNHRKGPNLSGIDPTSRKITRLFHPRRHKWERHFRWQGAILVGRTPIGRATVNVLAINLPYRIALRQALIEEGLFPSA